MKKLAQSGLLALLVIGALGCNDTHQRDTGGVLLRITSSPELPLGVAVNSSGGILQIPSLTLSSIVENPSADTSSLMNIELTTYQVVYRRVDGGTLTPVAFTSRTFGTVPPNGTFNVVGLQIMGPDQLFAKPLSDLLQVNGGFDRETGKTFIQLEAQLTIFGKTVSGREVVSNTAAWTLTARP